MYVITADQRASRRSDDLVPDALDAITRIGGDGLTRPPQRNAGDEVQALTHDAATALAVALTLLRERAWTVGIGVGDVETPVPDDIRAARGPAFILARDAVERAKSSPLRAAVTAESAAAADAEAVLRLLVEVRDRRSPAGWEVADLLTAGLTQAEAATRLGITPTAVSLRAKAGGLRAEEQALPALERLLSRADASVSDPRGRLAP